jgi:hypothetical protein
LANAAQLILSFCYLAINSECTAMAGAAEWNSFASSRKGLRVTGPVGQQRDTYFSQLPYRWSLPLTIISGGLHWLLSQSIFLVRIDTYDRKGKLVEGESSKSACGFSPTSFTVLTICFFLLVGILGLIGRKKINVRTPFAASCSLVIGAACHTPLIDAEAYLKPVQWGVVEETMYNGELYCSIFSKSVTRPKAGTTFLWLTIALNNLLGFDLPNAGILQLITNMSLLYSYCGSFGPQFKFTKAKVSAVQQQPLS